jgi:hypothetical protein
MICWWCRKPEATPLVCNDEQTIAMCGPCAEVVAKFMRPRDKEASSPSGWQPRTLRWIAHATGCAVMNQDARFGWRSGDEEVCNCGLVEWLRGEGALPAPPAGEGRQP